IGAMFVLIGNQLGKSRSMYLVGIRTPWTLASEEVWIRTHRPWQADGGGRAADDPRRPAADPVRAPRPVAWR
ncbi:MAG TPA: SdpI family protein, partial [Allosphingosinicella sp.]|nr:SdpI family protein [Allosphingosinicella sp.]